MSKKDEAKKRRERSVFDRFVRELSITPSDIAQPDPPRADVEFCLNGETIALDITVYCHDKFENPKDSNRKKGSNLMRTSSFRTSLLADAREYFESELGMSARVQIDWKNVEFPVNREARKRLAKAMALVVAQMRDSMAPEDQLPFDISEACDYGNCTPSELSRNARAIEEFVNSIAFVPKFSEDDNDDLWSDSFSFWVPPINDDVIRKTIEKKKMNLIGYRKGNADQVWLLIHVGSDESSLYDSRSCPKRFPTGSGFDRIILFGDAVGAEDLTPFQSRET
jgi:hypothetical protein